MRRWPMLLVVLVAGVVFAGCVSEKPEPAPVETTESTGAVKGKILTTGLDPVPGALVGLVQGDVVASTRTDENGEYVLGDVAPGTYLLQATGLCCRAGVMEVVVTAGATSTGDLQLEPLGADDLQVPSMKEEEWRGFISCGVSTAAASAALCSFTEDTPAEDPNEEFMKRFNVSKGLKTLVVAMDWEPTGSAAGQTFRLLVENDGCDVQECSYRYADLRGAPPLVVHVNNGDITDAAWLWDAMTAERPLQFRVFAEGDATLVYQQPFTIYYTMFYWQEAPEDYNPIPDA